MSENTNTIQLASCTIKELLECNVNTISNTAIEGELTIPEYQRPYVWQEEQVKQLIEDIQVHKKQKEPKPLFYLGSIILHQDGEALNIIDGQQRIITLLMLFLLLGDDSCVDLKITSPTGQANIRRMFSELDKKADLEGIISEDLFSINVTLVVTQSLDDAYIFFETQNTGGVRLDSEDLIKAHHLRAVSNGWVEYQARKWEKMNIKNLKYVLTLLSRIRRWTGYNWKPFATYYDTNRRKNIIDDFINNKYYALDSKHCDLHFVNAQITQYPTPSILYSPYMNIRQPLAEGGNTIDYISCFVNTYYMLFLEDKKDSRLDQRYIDFRNHELITQTYGTYYLKELFAMALLSYVSRFGTEQIYEFSLWAFRLVYSQRVATKTSVRELGVKNHQEDTYLLDMIINSHTHQQVIYLLQEFTYVVDEDIERNVGVKGRYLERLIGYFKEIDIKKFDKILVNKIKQKVENCEDI